MKTLTLFAAMFGLGLAAPSLGGTLSLSGTFQNTNPPAATGGRCANLTVNIANIGGPLFATGTSNFGAFTATQSHCLDSGPPIAVSAPSTPYYDGLFTYSFSNGATLSGTYSGLLTNSGVIGVIDNVQNFVVTGGTGLFAHASGSFVGTGTIRFAGGPPSATLTITDATIAVPEPATWGLFIVGFSVAGLAVRARRVVDPARSAT